MTPEPSIGILSLAPVTLALVLAFLTRNAVFSLLVGCVAGVVMTGMDPATGLAELFQDALGFCNTVLATRRPGGGGWWRFARRRGSGPRRG
jgi:hypothetical protein